MNLKEGACHTDGKGIERVWSEQKGCSSSTKEMGPGAHHDTLDDQLGAHNALDSVGFHTWIVIFVIFIEGIQVIYYELD